jgi:hypothetical protein
MANAGYDFTGMTLRHSLSREREPLTFYEAVRFEVLSLWENPVLGFTLKMQGVKKDYEKDDLI